jgi:hypothetical protein
LEEAALHMSWCSVRRARKNGLRSRSSMSIIPSVQVLLQPGWWRSVSAERREDDSEQRKNIECLLNKPVNVQNFQ